MKNVMGYKDIMGYLAEFVFSSIAVYLTEVLFVILYGVIYGIPALIAGMLHVSSPLVPPSNIQVIVVIVSFFVSLLSVIITKLNKVRDIYESYLYYNYTTEELDWLDFVIATLAWFIFCLIPIVLL